MKTTELDHLLDTVHAAADTLAALAPDGPDQAELVSIIGAAARSLRAGERLTDIPAGDRAALHHWRHAVVGQISLFMTAAELLANDADHPLPEPARACAQRIYAAAEQMYAFVETYVAAHDGP
jgi:hypothetical protein